MMSLGFSVCNENKLFIFFCCFWFCVVIQKYPWVPSHVLPGCVWDWSHPTLWLLQTEILRADWCLVARRLGHLGRGRHCCREIWSRVTGMVGKVRESRLALETPFIHRATTASQHQRQCLKEQTFNSKEGFTASHYHQKKKKQADTPQSDH